MGQSQAIKKSDLKSLCKTKDTNDLKSLVPFLEKYMAIALPIYQAAPDSVKQELRQKNFVLHTVLRLGGV